jgi:AcrR family transcriptional regulator
MSTESRPRRRQERGRRRMEQLLDAAAEVFAESGYAKATTNAIAARAGVSPGTLYQFFRNKQELADALAERYVAALSAAHEAAFSGDVDGLAVSEVVDRIVDPLLAANLAHPGFAAMLADPAAPLALLAGKQDLRAAMLGRIEALLRSRAPQLEPRDAARTAVVCVSVYRGLLPLVEATDGDERSAVTRELKAVLTRYLAPLLGEPSA